MKRNINKYILIPGLVILFISSFVSCKKFLTEKQVSSLTQDYYNNENGLNALINGLYVISRVKHEWEVNGARLIEPESDAYMTVDANYARVASANYGTNVALIANNNVFNFLGSANSNYAPMGCYPHINNCNIALDVIDNIKPGKYGTDETYRKQRRSEILMLRAWAYYLVSNQLGDVPLLLTPKREDNGIYFYPKAKLEDVFKQIIADVRFAYENLPTTGDRGRLTKWAAGHFLAKLYLNRAQAAGFSNSAETHLKMLYKGNVATDLDSCITIASEVIAGKGGAGGLAADYWTLFNPAVSETGAQNNEVLWAAQFDLNIANNGRFGGNRSCNYHTGDYTANTGVTRVQAYGRPFATFKPTDFAYDNYHNKVDDSRYYKTFQYEYIANMPANTSTSFAWTAASASWWNANKPAGEPTVTSGAKRILSGKRALIYLENQKTEALDSTMVMSLPYQFMVRWVYSAATNKYYYRLNINGSNNMGLATGVRNIYLSSKKYVDPTRGGSADEANFNSENGTRDALLMRLAETFLIRAEAYGRKGQYANAVADINAVRNRAAYKSGEQRPGVLVEWEPQASTLTAPEKVSPYPANGSSVTKMAITENIFTPGTPEAIAEGYIPTVTSKEQAFIHFIYNEKAREFLSEGIAWEDLHNAGILYERVVYLNQMASDKTGLWPVAANTDNGNGQNGNGKGQYQKFHTFRPWPNNYLIQLTDEAGKVLDDAGKAAYQNPGY